MPAAPPPPPPPPAPPLLAAADAAPSATAGKAQGQEGSTAAAEEEDEGEADDDDAEAADERAEAAVLSWSANKSAVDMLMTIGEVWPDCQPPASNQGGAQINVRREYLRMCRKIHPDKQAVASSELQRAMSRKVFACLTDAYRYYLEDTGG